MRDFNVNCLDEVEQRSIHYYTTLSLMKIFSSNLYPIVQEIMEH